MVSTSIGFNFSASSVVKKACLVAINVLLMLLGIAVAVLSLYQVKLMPESYDLVASRYSEVAVSVTGTQGMTSDRMTANPLGKTGDVTTKQRRSPDFLLPAEERTFPAPLSLDENLVTPTSPSQLLSADVVSIKTTKLGQEALTTVKSVESRSGSTTVPTHPTLSNFSKLQRYLEGEFNMEKKATTKSPLPKNPSDEQVLDGSSKKKRSLSKVLDPSGDAKLPYYFEEIFYLVQTSLYVSIGAGLIIFLSALMGVCGGVCRVPLCLKLGVCGIALVMVLEMATTAFVFLSHDKMKNRNKHKDFDVITQKLCDDANFCVNPMMLVLIGTFLCISIVFQVGSITISCKLINDQADEYFVGDGNMCGVTTEHRRFLRNWRGPMPGPSLPMFPSNCGGFYSCGMIGGMGQYPSMMPMQQFPMYPPMPQAPFCYPSNGGSRPTVNLAFVS